MSWSSASIPTDEDVPALVGCDQSEILRLQSRESAASLRTEEANKDVPEPLRILERNQTLLL